MGLRQAWSLTLNVRTKKPSLDKNECSKTNEAKITSKASYQISVAASESDANVNVSQPPTTFKSFVAGEYWERIHTETKLWHADTLICLQKSTKSTIHVWVSKMVGKTENFFAFLSYDRTNVFTSALHIYPLHLMLQSVLFRVMNTSIMRTSWETGFYWTDGGHRNNCDSGPLKVSSVITLGARLTALKAHRVVLN